MADLSNLFAAPQLQRQAGPFDLAAPQAEVYKRKIVMNEALQQDLAPEDGPRFFKFVSRRLFELGDTAGALAVNQQAQQILGGQAQAQAEAEQQAFQNDLATRRLDQQGEQFEARLGFDQGQAESTEKHRDRTFKQTASNQAATLNASNLRFEELKRSNLAGESMAAEQLEFKKSEATAKRLSESFKDEGIDLSESEGKALTLVAQLAPAMELLDAPDLANHIPSKAAVSLINQLAGSGDNLVGAMRKLFNSSVYENLSEADQRYISHGLTVIDMALRDRTGATMNAGEIGGEFLRLLPQPGNSQRIIEEKRQARQNVLSGLMSKLPPGAMEKLIEVAGRE